MINICVFPRLSIMINICFSEIVYHDKYLCFPEIIYHDKYLCFPEIVHHDQYLFFFESLSHSKKLPLKLILGQYYLSNILTHYIKTISYKVIFTSTSRSICRFSDKMLSEFPICPYLFLFTPRFFTSSPVDYVVLIT